MNNNKNAFKKATKHESKLRLALIGPSGTGKTYSALAIASNLGSRVAVIDTERGSASKYADLFDFDVLELDRYSPVDYVESIRQAEEAGYDVLVIDSLSHAWSGRGGALEMVDSIAKRSKTANSFSAWRDVTPLHNDMVDSMIGCKCHVIVTLRAKTEWVQEKDERGKTHIRKVGMAAVQRDGMEYEFDVVGDLDQDNALTITKTRCPALTGAVVVKPGVQLANVLAEWLHGAPPPPPKPKAAPQPEKDAAETAPPAKPAAGPSFEAVCKGFQDAKTEVELVEAGQHARGLPAGHQAAARKAYAHRLSEIRARAANLAALRAAMTDPMTGQAFIDHLGENGISIADAASVDSLSDETLAQIASDINQANQVDQ